MTARSIQRALLFARSSLSPLGRRSPPSAPRRDARFVVGCPIAGQGGCMRFVRGLGGIGLVALFAALAVAGTSITAYAQTTSASVSGVVQDSQGGVLPG